MTTTNLPLYQILIRLGATIPEAEAAVAASAVDVAVLATKLDLRVALAEFEARLAWKIGALIVGAMVSMTGIFALIVGWMVTP